MRPAWRAEARRIGRDLAFLAVGAVLFGGVYALLQLVVYGRVRW